MSNFGFTMIVNGIPVEYKGIQMIEQRMLFYVDPNLPYNDIKHKLLYGYYTDFAFSKPIKLDDVLNDCKKYNIIPIVNICATEGSWKGKGITPQQYGKIGGVIRDILKERGFKKGSAYMAGFNEPGKVLSTDQTISYTNALHDIVGDDFDVVYGNDEFNMLDWNKMGRDCRAAIEGVHPLSSLGTWTEPKKYFKNIKDWKTIADTYGKKIICTEGGSWFKDYCKEGHQINLDILAECKKYDIDCLIVLPDINEAAKKEWKLLGYRIWNTAFTEQVSGCENKFNEFMDYIKLNGTVPIFEEDEEYMKLEKYYYRLKVTFNRDKTKAGIRFIQTVLEIEPDGKWGDATDKALVSYQITNGLIPDKIVGPLTFREMMKTDPKAYIDLQYFVAVGDWQ